MNTLSPKVEPASGISFNAVGDMDRSDRVQTDHFLAFEYGVVRVVGENIRVHPGVPTEPRTEAARFG